MDLHAVSDDLQKDCYRKSEQCGWLHLVGVTMAAMSIGLLGGHIISDRVSGWLAIGGSTAVGLGLWRGRHAQMANWRSRFARRRALLADSLAYDSAESETLDITTDILERTHLNDGALNRRYYSSLQAVGPERLRENLIESAIWTEKLFKVGQRVFFNRTVVALATALVLAMATIFFRAGTLDYTSVIQLFSVALVFVVSADQFDASAKWGWAAQEAMRLRLVATAVDVSKPEAMPQLWAAFTDYAVVTTVAPPVPRYMFDANRGALDVLSHAWLRVPMTKDEKK